MVPPGAPRKTKIFVGRLPENCRDDELRSLFVRFGEVTECDVMNRYGFVHMAREEDAAEAIKALHNTQFKGATINVEQSTGKSRNRNERRGGPMRGGRGGRDGGRPGPYNDRRGGGAGGYNDYRGGGDFGGRGDYGGGYERGYGQQGNMGYGSNAPMGGGYGPGGGGGYGPGGNADYGRNDYGRGGDYGARNDGYGGRAAGGGMAADYNRAPPAPAEYARQDNFAPQRADPYGPRADYDRGAVAPMRNGSGAAAGAYGAGYGDVGYVAPKKPMGGAPAYAGPGPQSDMFSRRGGGAAAPGGGYQGGYGDSYERGEQYGPPPRGGNRFPGPAEPIPPRY